MKKFIVLILAACLVQLTACQATPQKDIVIGKSLDNMIEKATKAETAQTQGKTLAEQTGASRTYQTELSDPAGRVSIHVNADVQIPDAGGVTVARVEQGKFTQQQVDTVIKHLMKGELFSGDDYKPTKSEIQEQIIQLEAAIQKEKSEKSVDKPGSKRSSNAMLEDLKSKLNSAPENKIKVPCSGKLQPMSMEVDYDTGEKLYALANSEDGAYQSLRIFNYSDGFSFLNYTSEKNVFVNDMGYFSPKESAADMLLSADELADIPEVKITREDAQAQAESLISDLGIDNMKCYSAEIGYGGSYERTPDQSAYLNPRKCVWLLRYTRNVKGVPVTYTPWDCIKVEDDGQSAPWPYEDMTFAIDDTGIVGFNWKSPYTMTDVVTENSNLLKFDELTKVFDTMSLAVNAWEGISEGNPNLKAVDISVDHIRLGLTRITEENKRNSGLLVPAWDFIGSMTYINEKDGKRQTFEDGPIPILTVNAIDGSIINRSLGY